MSQLSSPEKSQDNISLPNDSLNADEYFDDSAMASGTKMKKVPKKMMTAVPISRVNSIMRSCPNLTTVKTDAIALTARAAELFIQELVNKAYEKSDDKELLTYNHLAEFVSESEYTFLKDAIPKKITVERYLEIVNNKENSN